MTHSCTYCGTKEEEMRPYGPDGAWLCFDCLMRDPEIEAAATKQFFAQLDACGSVALIGTEVGPISVDENLNTKLDS